MKDLLMIYRIWRIYDMYRNTMGFVKGLGTGIVASVAVASVGSRLMKDKKKFRKNANKAMRTVGDIVDNVEYMFK